MTNERWRDVPGMPGYKASNLGNVRGVRGNLLKPFKHRSGHLVLGLSIGGKKRSCGVHRLVCLAFNGLPPKGRVQATHINGKHDDNRAGNLRWATAAQNSADMILHGVWADPEKRAEHRRVGARGGKIKAENAKAKRADVMPDDAVRRLVRMIGKTLTWRDVEEITTFSTATLRRHYRDK